MKTTAAAVLTALISFLTGNVWVFVNAGMFVQYFYEARIISSWACLAVVALIGLWLAIVSSFDVQLQFVYGFLYMFGWLSLMILGMRRPECVARSLSRMRRSPCWSVCWPD